MLNRGLQNLETFRRKVYKGFLSSFLCFYKKDGKVPDRERHWRLCRHNSREAANTVAAATGKGCRQGRRKSTRSVPSRQGQTFRRKVTKAARPPKKRPQGGKGFNWVSAKSLLGCADSRFAKPRKFPERETDLFFSLVRKEPKVPQRFANLWTPGTIQISARFKIFAKMTGHHHVTGRTGNRNLSGYRR